MVKPKGEVIYSGSKPGHAQLVEVESFEIAAWCPDDEARQPPTQVHMILKIKGLEEYPIAIRFTGPETLGFFIEELARYRREVWRFSEPVSIDEPAGPEDHMTDEQWYEESRR